MNKIVLHDAFVGQGCDGSQSPQPAVTIESGAMWIDAYNAVTTVAGRYVQGGGYTTVGVAELNRHPLPPAVQGIPVDQTTGQ
jgi:hypothetical protein